MLIHEKILAVMADSSAIAKDRKNDQQGYKFRGIDDVYASLHPILAKHGVFAYPEVIADKHEERQTAKGGTLIYRVLTIKYHFCASDGSEIVACVIGEGMDSGDKASNKAMSVAHKYALLQVFAIPTEEDKDPEIDSPEPAPRNNSKPAHPGAKEECTRIADELKLSGDERKTMFDAAGQNYSNLLIMLKAQAMDVTLDKVFEAAK